MYREISPESPMKLSWAQICEIVKKNGLYNTDVNVPFQNKKYNISLVLRDKNASLVKKNFMKW